MAIPRPKAAEQRMLGHAHFETLSHINSRAPAPLYSNGIERPGIKRLRKILAKEEFRFSKEKEPPQLSPPERPNLNVSGEHVTGKSRARIVHTAGNSRVRPTQVGINFIVRRREVELPISPEHVTRKEHSVRG